MCEAKHHANILAGVGEGLSRCSTSSVSARPAGVSLSRRRAYRATRLRVRVVSPHWSSRIGPPLSSPAPPVPVEPDAVVTGMACPRGRREHVVDVSFSAPHPRRAAFSAISSRTGSRDRRVTGPTTGCGAVGGGAGGGGARAEHPPVLAPIAAERGEDAWPGPHLALLVELGEPLPADVGLRGPTTGGALGGTCRAPTRGDRVTLSISSSMDVCTSIRT
jgi:hypothetical protein